jgi:L-aspartate oxidase
MAAQQAFAAEMEALRQQGKSGRRLSEALAISSVANAILRSALARTESRGAHFRNDFPQRDDVKFQKHSVFSGADKVTFENWQ